MVTTGYSTHVGTKGTGGRDSHAVNNSAKLKQVSNHNRNKGRDDTEVVVGSGNAYNDVKNVYARELPNAKKEYNAYQIHTGHSERIITGSWFKHMSDDGKSHLATELIIGIGDKDFWGENDAWEYMSDDESRELLKKLLDKWQENHPYFHVASAIIHNRHDGEKSWHMHVVGVPIIPISEIPLNRKQAFQKDENGKYVKDSKGKKIPLYWLDNKGKKHIQYEVNPDGSFVYAKPNNSGLNKKVCQSAVITPRSLDNYHAAARATVSRFYSEKGIEMRPKGEHARNYRDKEDYIRNEQIKAKEAEAQKTLEEAKTQAVGIKADAVKAAEIEAEKIKNKAKEEVKKEVDKIKEDAAVQASIIVGNARIEKDNLDAILPGLRAEYKELKQTLTVENQRKTLDEYKLVQKQIEKIKEDIKNGRITADDDLLQVIQAVYNDDPDMADGLIAVLDGLGKDDLLQDFYNNNLLRGVHR